MPSTSGELIDAVPPAFTMLSEQDSLFYSPSIGGELYTGPSDSLEVRVSIAALTNLVNAAQRSAHVASRALSWRKFNVGSTAIMTNHDTGMMGMMNGFNVKPQQGPNGLNVHAEQMAISKGRRLGLNRVVGITVFAEPNDEDANPLNRPTLAPCPRCTDMFLHIPEVDDRTIILGTDTTLRTCELYSVGSFTKPNTKPLIEGTFSLETDEDLNYYDQRLKVAAVDTIVRRALETTTPNSY